MCGVLFFSIDARACHEKVWVEVVWEQDSNLLRLLASISRQDTTSGKTCVVELVLLGQQLCIGVSIQ